MESPGLAIGNALGVEEKERWTRGMEDETRRDFQLRIIFMIAEQ